jgi:hypothetical protein
MDRYLEYLDVDVTTRTRYEIAIRKHISPLLGRHSIANLNGETFDSFYKTLRTCRAHCDGRPFVEHGVAGAHECNKKCHRHRCAPFVRSLHPQDSLMLEWRVQSRYSLAVDHRQSVRSSAYAETPTPDPPSPKEATAIVNEAFKDLSWGKLVWLAMTTGARRGELRTSLGLAGSGRRHAANPHPHRAGRSENVGKGHQERSTAPHHP